MLTISGGALAQKATARHRGRRIPPARSDPPHRSITCDHTRRARSTTRPRGPNGRVKDRPGATPPAPPTGVARSSIVAVSSKSQMISVRSADGGPFARDVRCLRRTGWTTFANPGSTVPFLTGLRDDWGLPCSAPRPRSSAWRRLGDRPQRAGAPYPTHDRGLLAASPRSRPRLCEPRAVVTSSASRSAAFALEPFLANAGQARRRLPGNGSSSPFVHRTPGAIARAANEAAAHHPVRRCDRAGGRHGCDSDAEPPRLTVCCARQQSDRRSRSSQRCSPATAPVIVTGAEVGCPESWAALIKAGGATVAPVWQKEPFSARAGSRGITRFAGHLPADRTCARALSRTTVSRWARRCVNTPSKVGSPGHTRFA